MRLIIIGLSFPCCLISELVTCILFLPVSPKVILVLPYMFVISMISITIKIIIK